MNPNDYQKGVIQRESNDMVSIADRLKDPRLVRILHAAIGLATESGELLDQVKKHIYYGRKLDETNLFEEAGDTLWYLGVLLDTLGKTFEECMDTNHQKLVARYGDSFTENRANKRDLETERQILESGHDS